jgi:hypothetical protein
MLAKTLAIFVLFLKASSVRSALSADQQAEQTLITTLLTGYNAIVKPDVILTQTKSYQN